MEIKTIKGIAVVSITDGERLGEVSDILFDLDERRVRGLVVSSGGVFSGTSRILDMSDVENIGGDAVMIASRDQLKADRSDARYQSFLNLSAMTSLRVVSQSGDLVGNLSTVRIDTSDGKFTDIEVSRHGLIASFGANILVPSNSVVSFGPDVAIIPDEFARPKDKSAEESSSEDQTGTLDPTSAR